MIVVDAAALIYADERGRTARDSLSRDIEWAAPGHWKAEVFAVVRGLALGAIDRLPGWAEGGAYPAGRAARLTPTEALTTV